MDTITTIEELKRKVQQFVEEREWQQFHCLKNLSMPIAIEVAELRAIGSNMTNYSDFRLLKSLFLLYT